MKCDGCIHYRAEKCIVKPYLKRKPYRCKMYLDGARIMNSERPKYGY